MNKFLLVLAGVWWAFVVSEVLSHGYGIRDEIKIITVLFVIAYMGYMTVDLLKKKD